MKKNEKYTLEIVDHGMGFEGIAKLNNIPIFINNALLGEQVETKIVKVNSSHAFGIIEKIKTKSKDREEPICEVYSKCGGCEALHTSYENTLKMKLNIVKNIFKKQNLDDKLIENIYGMGNPYWYRNKVQYPVRNINGKTVMGMYAKRTHNIIENKDCFIHDKKIHEVARSLFDLLIKNGYQGYNEKTNKGDIKNIIIRKGIHTNELMCIIVVTKECIKKDKKLNVVVKELTKRYEDIKSIMLNINEKDDNAILSDNNICIFGENHIKDMIGKYIFKISANSFFQVNTIQAEVLYNILKEQLSLEKNKTLLELYSGVGSIGIFLSDNVKEVYGIEIIKEAVEMSKENARFNNINNTCYIEGDATKEIEKLQKEGKVFDYIVVDPPRKGLDSKVIQNILKLGPRKVGYISCNPATLARDLKLLSEMYEIKTIKLVDMFPWTSHVECCSLLCRKQTDKAP